MASFQSGLRKAVESERDILPWPRLGLDILIQEGVDRVPVSNRTFTQLTKFVVGRVLNQLQTIRIVTLRIPSDQRSEVPQSVGEQRQVETLVGQRSKR